MVHSLYIDPQHLTARLCRIRSIAVDDYPHFNIDTAFLQENLTLQADFMFLHIAPVHRFVNNCTNRVGCGFECAGLKTQA